MTSITVLCPRKSLQCLHLLQVSDSFFPSSLYLPEHFISASPFSVSSSSSSAIPCSCLQSNIIALSFRYISCPLLPVLSLPAVSPRSSAACAAEEKFQFEKIAVPLAITGLQRLFFSSYLYLYLPIACSLPVGTAGGGLPEASQNARFLFLP